MYWSDFLLCCTKFRCSTLSFYLWELGTVPLYVVGVLLVGKIQLDCVLSLSSQLSTMSARETAQGLYYLRAHGEWVFGAHYLGLSVITPVLPLALSQKHVSRKLPRVHARKYIANKLLRSIPITLTMTPHLIETVQSGAREKEMGTKGMKIPSHPPQSIVLLKQNHCISQGNRHLIPPTLTSRELQ